MVTVVIYSAEKNDLTDETRKALLSSEFHVVEVVLPESMAQNSPSPVAHFCGKGVVFGNDNIVSFATTLQLQ